MWCLKLEGVESGMGWVVAGTPVLGPPILAENLENSVQNTALTTRTPLSKGVAFHHLTPRFFLYYVINSEQLL